MRRHLLRQDVAEPLQQRLGALVVVSGVSPEMYHFVNFYVLISGTPYHLSELLESDVDVS